MEKSGDKVFQTTTNLKMRSKSSKNIEEEEVTLEV